MQLTPIGNQAAETARPSKTWRIDFERKRITGTIHGLDALRQAVFLCLSTERYEHVIYSRDYGVETKNLMGQSYDLARKALEEAVKDALGQDERVKSVGNFAYSHSGDVLMVSFAVTGVGGTMEMEVGAVV